jgi:hypothetical protein
MLVLQPLRHAIHGVHSPELIFLAFFNRAGSTELGHITIRRNKPRIFIEKYQCVQQGS